MRRLIANDNVSYLPEHQPPVFEDIRGLLTEMRGYLPETFDSQRPIAKLISDVKRLELGFNPDPMRRSIERHLRDLDDRLALVRPGKEGRALYYEIKRWFMGLYDTP